MQVMHMHTPSNYPGVNLRASPFCLGLKGVSEVVDYGAESDQPHSGLFYKSIKIATQPIEQERGLSG